MNWRVKSKGIVLGIAVLLLVTVASALAADPTDTSFGTNGIAEIEARIPATGQVGGIVDLEPATDGKVVAAVNSIAAGGHYFAAARFLRDGRLDRTFGHGGFTSRFRFGRDSEVEGGGVLQAEAVAGQKDGKVLLAGYREVRSAYAPAVARFTSRGKLDRGFGTGGRITPRPTYGGRQVKEGGVRLHDIAVEPDGTIVTVGDVIPQRYRGTGRGPARAAAVVFAYRPDGTVDRAFGRDGHLTITPPRSRAYTGFTEVKALPSGKLLVSGYLRQQIVLYRLTSDGGLDRSFGRDGRVMVGKPSVHVFYGRGAYLRAPFTVDRRGRIVLAGDVFPSGARNPEEPVALLRLLPDGRRDRSFGRSVYMERAPIDAQEPHPHRRGVQSFSFDPQAIAIDGRGRIVVTGGELAPYTRGQQEPGHRDFTSRRFLPSGRRDNSFGEGGVWHTDPPGSESLARAALAPSDGTVVAGGWIQIERGGGNGPGNTAMLLTRYR
jgi:uncharacterized delta-60 repeat protein